MMKIKEMTKLYKKISKAKEMYEDAELMIRGTALDDISEYLIDCITNAKKAANTVKKIAESLSVTVEFLTANIETEERFCYWCMMNGLEIKTTESEETDEETEEE